MLEVMSLLLSGMLKPKKQAEFYNSSKGIFKQSKATFAHYLFLSISKPLNFPWFKAVGILPDFNPHTPKNFRLTG